jgi:radical SAM protein with 4Fe4S-binding SPASM domain
LSRELRCRSIEVALVTNGTLLDEAAIERALAAEIHTIGISIDGLRSTHDATRRFVSGAGSAFDAAVAGVRRARSRFVVNAITQVNRTNLHELPEIGRMLGELGVARWQIQLAIPTPHLANLTRPYLIAPAELEFLTDFILAATEDPRIPRIHTSDTIGYATPAEARLRHKASGPGVWLGCSAGIRVVAIKYDGTVRGCSLLPSEFTAGDLHGESLASIWGDRSRFAYSTAFDAEQLCGGCRRCRVGPICRAGCTTMAYYCTGTTGDNPYCLRRVLEQGS